MKEYCTVQERNAFDHEIIELVQECLDDNCNLENIGISINPHTLELTLNDQRENPEGWDFYPIEGLIRSNEDNAGNEPDSDVTFEIASSYCFVR